MRHRRKQRIGHLMPGDVEHRDARSLTASRQAVGDGGLSLGGRLGDAGVQVVSLLEVDVDEVVAAGGATEGPRAAPDVNPLQSRHLSRLGDQLLRDLLKIFELFGKRP